jgi:hypothetical protein
VEKYGKSRQATGDNKIRRMRISCWIIKATDTPSEYLIFIAFPRQQRLRERSSILRLYVYRLCCVIFLKINIQRNLPITEPLVTNFPLHWRHVPFHTGT